MDIVEYLNEKDDLEIREKRLFEIIDKIDKESYKLFSEVTDLDLNSYYKVDNLYIRINHVTDMLEEVSNIYDSLACLEANTLISIRKKRSRKKLLVALISSLIVFINLYIGLINYLIFSSIVDNSHIKKLE